MRKPFLAIIGIALFASLAHCQGTSTAVRKSIESNNKRFVDVFNKGDAAAVAAMYTSNARLLPPNSPMIGGRQGIQEFWQSLITAGVKAVRLETDQVEACGNTAYEVGKYTLTIPSLRGGTLTDEGKYVVIWKRQGKQWKLAADTFNTSMPMATP